MFDFGIWTEGQGGVPAGAYPGVFTGTVGEPANEEKGWGEGVKFLFEITAGEHKGKTPIRIVTKTKPGPNNGLGRMLVALLGAPPKPGDSINIEACIGRPYTIIVAATPKGGTRVETVAPMS
ncbi:hypothetical protein [Paludisphaera sp.]|uniref:hypothetical protein n=1 Tax=Paludisphaera sp. TaxID=2017432 RepID=UPI00301D66FF